MLESNLISEIEDTYILDFGTFYFCTHYIVSEVNEGVTFSWKNAEKIMELGYAHYGKDVKISYISNRINSYAVVPQDWLKLFRGHETVQAVAVITYNKSALTNIMMEKLFFLSQTLRQFESLETAAAWITKNRPAIRSKTYDR
ncbi:hypothetical protein EAX61_05165 [Dokdonia sinensis]|uniref:STAS/SEC14 domain-containing protein n=2 Tax=Dokdonia sinensis TaxID=2479847 RepID=A0A3M0G7D7_9FLAO|nr:hypothetical protein EAX61_05165 [Dokdonia sinensis]